MRRFLLFLPIFLCSAHFLLSSEVETTQIPNPLDLAPNWWRYYSADENNLEQRLDQAEERYQIQLQELDSDKRELAEILIKRIRANIASFIALKKQLPEQILPDIPEKANYTFDDFIEAAAAFGAAKDNLASLNEEIDLLTLRIREIQRAYDALYLNYLKEQEGSSARFISGLELIAQRSRLAVLQERKRLFTQNRSLYSQRASLFDEHLKHVGSHLSPTPEDRATFLANVTLAQEELALSRRNLVRAEEDVNIPTGEAKIDLALTQLLKQRVLLAFTYFEMKKLRLAFLEAKISFVDLLNEQDFEEIVKGFEHLRDTISLAKDQLPSWQRASELERDSASKSVIALESTEEPDPSLLQIEKLRAFEAQQTLVEIQKFKNELFVATLFKDFFQNELIQRRSLLFRNLGFTFQTLFIRFHEGLLARLNTTLFSLGEVPVTLYALLRAIFIFFSAVLFSFFLRRFIKRVVEGRGALAQPTVYTLLRLIHYFILFIGFLIAFASLGFTFQNLALILGALSVGIGFGLQHIVNNFICGLIILFERSIKIGDYVELETGHWGKIVEIKVQNTVLHTREGIDILVPNSQIVSNRLINWTRQDPYLRLRVKFSVAYGTDQKKLQKLVVETVKDIPSTITGTPGISEPKIVLTAFGASSLDYELVVWVNIVRSSSGRNALKGAYLSAILNAFSENGIEIPFPQRDLHIKTLPPSLEEKKNDKEP